MKQDKNKRMEKTRKNETSIIRSSAAEYLTFVAAGGNSETSVEMRYEDENIWLTQKMMATLYDVSVPAINQHLKRIFGDNELERGATIKKYLIVQTEGRREVRREIEHFNLQAIIAVGFKVENERAIQFRQWATQHIREKYESNNFRADYINPLVTKQQHQHNRQIPSHQVKVINFLLLLTNAAKISQQRAPLLQQIYDAF